MRYYVIGDDGSKYGPADIQTLNGWINEGRLLSKTLLEEEASGTRIAAGAVQELTFPPAAAPTPPGAPEQAAANAGPYANRSEPTTGPYAKGPYMAGPVDDGKGFVVGAWIFSGLGLLGCCFGGFVLAGIGLILSIVANGKGNSSAKPALIFSAVILVISLGMSGYEVSKIMQVSNAIKTGDTSGFTNGMTPAQKAKFDSDMKKLNQQLKNGPGGAPGTAPTTGQ